MENYHQECLYMDASFGDYQVFRFSIFTDFRNFMPGTALHCVKSVRIRSCYGLYFPIYLSVVSPNAGKYGPA